MKFSVRAKLSLAVCIFVLGTIFIAVADAQSPVVYDKGILENAQDDDLGYRERHTGVLYEGNYNKPVSSSIDFPLLSVRLVRFPKTWNSKTVIRIQRPKLDNVKDIIRVRARSMARDHYYQMDGWFHDTNLNQIEWNIGDVLQHPKAKVKLGADQVGIYGWFNKGADRIYVPLKTSPGESCGKDTCEVILRTDMPLRGFYYHITRWATGQQETVSEIRAPVMAGGLIRILFPVNPGEEIDIDFNALQPGKGSAVPVGPFHIRIPQDG